jgi:H+/Cl- antiporter ClcA
MAIPKGIYKKSLSKLVFTALLAVITRLWTQNHHGMLAVHLYDHWLAQVLLLLSLGCLFGRISAHTMQSSTRHPITRSNSTRIEIINLYS